MAGQLPGTSSMSALRFSTNGGVCSADDFQIADNLPSTEGNECFHSAPTRLPSMQGFRGVKAKSHLQRGAFRTPPCPRKRTASLLNFVLRQDLLSQLFSA